MPTDKTEKTPPEAIETPPEDNTTPTPDLLAEITAAVEDPELAVADEDEEDAAPVAAATDDAQGAPDPAATVVDAQAAPDKAQPDPAVEKEISDLGLKGKAQERFRTMTDTLKAKDQELEAQRQDVEAMQQWRETLLSTKASPEDLGGALEILHHANLGTPDGARHALTLIDGFRAKLAQQFGIEAAGVDHLAGFDDLKQQVEAGDLTPAAARELAGNRRQASDRQQRDRQLSEQTTHERAITEAGSQVDAFCAQLKQNDPLYAKKFVLVKPLIPVIAKTVPPDQWLATFKAYYANVVVPQVTDTRRSGADNPQPLRRSAGGGGNATPATHLDAVKQALNL